MSIFAMLTILACFVVGIGYSTFSPKIDAEPEQFVEEILHENHIDIDFSKAKKDKLAAAAAEQALENQKK